MSTEQVDPPETAAGGGRRVLSMLILGVLAAFTAQQILMPVLAPLAREVSLSEFQLGLVMSVAATVLAATSPLWGRACDRVGHRRVLVTGLLLATIGLAGFAVASRVALAGELPSPVTLGLMLATRSALFGAGLAAVPVAAIAYVGATTSETATRVAGLSRVAAAQGVSTALGPALGGLLAFGGLLAPLYAAPLVVAGVAGLVVLALPAPPPAPARTGTPRPLGRGVRPFDPRVWPFLLTGFALYLCLGLVLLTIGFLLQDRLGLTAPETARATGAVTCASGFVLVGVQGALVPRLGWSPARLLRTGAPIAVVGSAALTVAPGLWTIGCAMMLLALGLATAIPGYTAGPTLSTAESEQGSVAGLVNATIGLTFALGPAAGTALYELSPPAPFLAAAAAALLGWAATLLHPALRRAARG